VAGGDDTARPRHQSGLLENCKKDFNCHLQISSLWPESNLRVPPDGAEPGGGGPVGRLVKVALLVALVQARRDRRVAEPVFRDGTVKPFL
jgi:hypothetical protein